MSVFLPSSRTYETRRVHSQIVIRSTSSSVISSPVRSFVRGHGLGVFERPAGFQVGGGAAFLTDLAHLSSLDEARATYIAALPPGESEPSFDEVIADGWLRIVWGRVATPFEIDQRARAAPDGGLTALTALPSRRFDERFSVRAVEHDDSDFESLVAAIERGDVRPDSLRSRTPDWVAARLWDRALSDNATRRSSPVGRSMAPAWLAVPRAAQGLERVPRRRKRARPRRLRRVRPALTSVTSPMPDTRCAPASQKAAWSISVSAEPSMERSIRS
jgi:hypothetical protein